MEKCSSGLGRDFVCGGKAAQKLFCWRFENKVLELVEFTAENAEDATCLASKSPSDCIAPSNASKQNPGVLDR
jgi:hypothetical protein